MCIQNITEIEDTLVLFEASAVSDFIYFSMSFLLVQVTFWSNWFLHVHIYPFIFPDTQSTIHRQTLICRVGSFHVLSLRLFCSGSLSYCSLSIWVCREDSVIQHVCQVFHIHLLHLYIEKSLHRKKDNMSVLVNMISQSLINIAEGKSGQWPMIEYFGT